MPTRAQFVAAARGWIGTPFHHQGRLRGVGCDCVGLVVGVCRELGIPVEDVPAYSKIPMGGLFEQAVFSQTDPVGSLADALPGDLLIFAFKPELPAQHIAILTEAAPVPRMVHAYLQARRTVENNIDPYWQTMLRGIRRLKGIE